MSYYINGQQATAEEFQRYIKKSNKMYRIDKPRTAKQREVRNRKILEEGLKKKLSKKILAINLDVNTQTVTRFIEKYNMKKLAWYF